MDYLNKCHVEGEKTLRYTQKSFSHNNCIHSSCLNEKHCTDKTLSRYY